MKRIIALAMGMLMLTGCGAAIKKKTATAPAEDIHWVGSDYYYTGEPDERFPLYVELPEDDIQLYGVEGSNWQGGMVLFHQGRASYFSDWGFTKYDYPRIAYYDFDGDGKKEIGVITLVNSGTGILLTDLHILTVHEDNGAFTYTDHAFTNEDVEAYFKKSLKFKRGKQANTVDLIIGGQSYTANLDPNFNWAKEVVMGSHVCFEFMDNGIQLHVLPKAWYYDGWAEGEVIAFFQANVTFDGKQFHLGDINLGPKALWEEYRNR